MRFLSPKKMALDLQQEKIGRGEFSVYGLLFGGSLVLLVLTFFGLWEVPPYSPEWLKMVDRTLVVLTSLGTLPLAYYANKKGDGKKFWYRYISLNTPTGIVTGVIGFFAFLGMALAGLINVEVFGYSDLILYLLLSALYFYLLWKYMRVAASGAEEVRPLG